MKEVISLRQERKALNKYSTNELRRLYWSEKMTLAEIGAMVNPPVTRERVRQVFEELGIARRVRGAPSPIVTQGSAGIYKTMADEYQQGKSLKDIADALRGLGMKASDKAVRRILVAAGVAIRGPGRGGGIRHRAMLQNNVYRLYALLRKHTYAEVAKQFNVCPTTIYRWVKTLKEMGYNAPRSRGTRNKTHHEGH